jgi:hypothetical protein
MCVSIAALSSVGISGKRQAPPAAVNADWQTQILATPRPHVLNVVKRSRFVIANQVRYAELAALATG